MRKLPFCLLLLLLCNICYAQLTCTNWLKTPDKLTGVTVGALDVAGDQLTVEATCNATDIYALSRALVSKHSNPSDVNYFLCPDLAQITTTNGLFSAVSPCSFVSNKTYHVAMVYNGSSLKLYRNGFLMVDIPASGNLVTNAWPATIGEMAYALFINDATISNIFKGYINDVRIWNVARTQQQIRNYMGTPLPNPTTQTGLLAYYTFDDLTNKQGNPVFNGTLQGAATINNTNTNCAFVVDSCPVITCNGWLHIPNSQSYVTIGEIDIPGTQITIEGVFRRDSALTPEGYSSLNIVSKHWTPADANYLLRVDRAQVTTTNGHFATPDICELKNKKIYHAAMTYDGAMLKFYQNGFLMSQVPCTGNMFQNDYLTTIAATANSPTTNTQLIGYLDEIRIWDVAKTQAELQQYVNGALPNPTTQPGLLGYYTFESLANKQGNAAYDGTLHGNALINAVIPDCNFIADSCNTIVSQSCKGVLELHGEDAVILPGPESIYYPPNGFTWECWFNSGWYSNNPAVGLGHSLLMTGDEIPCEDIQIGFGWRNVPQNRLCFAVDGPGACNNYDLNPCSYQPPGGFLPDTWYHVTGVKNYTSNQTELYVNGQLVDTKFNDKQPLTRDILSFIGRYPMRTDSGFLGKVDEIRYWNYPRSATEIQADYDKCLTGNENGLVAYFRANESSGTIAHDATSFQRNSILEPGVLWNNTINAPLINSCASPISSTISVTICQGQSHQGYNTTGTYIDTFPGSNGCDSIRNLNLTVNNCITGISGIINDYTPVISFNPCKNEMVVEDAAAFSVDDTVLVIQMKGALIDSTNTASFGDVLDYKNTGNYEFNYVKSVTGNVIELKNVLLRPYDIPVGKVQLIRVPYYKNVNVTGTVTCLPWDGKKGGVLVLKATDSISLQADIDITSKGFAGGKGTIFAGGSYRCFLNDYYMPFNFDSSGMKGESISLLSIQKMYAKGNNASGGGGGMNHNGGGAGGGNGGTGGDGGYLHINCSNNSTNLSIGGKPLTYSNANNKAFMGSGGGAAQANNGSDASGGNGGGLAIISANFLAGNLKSIIAKGGDAPVCNPIGNTNIGPCHDGGGGGGAGGTILLDVNNMLSAANINLNGGNGANLTYLGGSPAGYTPLGPGSGGGGGIAWIKNPLVSPLLTISNNGGINGVIISDGNIPWGAQPGFPGISLNNLALPVVGPLFKANIDSSRIRDSVTACKTIGFKGLAFTNRNAIQSWQWSFGDNSFANTQNTSHVYANAGNYNIKLVVTDVNGCKDSISKAIIVADCPSVSINEYAAVLSIDVCTNTMIVDDATKFNAGDTIVIMQMKGAAIDSSNSSTFGTISNYNNAGKYEFNYVKSKAGNTIEIANTFLNKYDASFGRVQLIRVAYFQSLNVSQTLTCPAWDGAKGGVLILNSANDITLNAGIDVSTKGFRGGAVGGGFNCGFGGAWANPTGRGGTKGEGIAEYIRGFEAGGARLANGGGGAYSANTGGGGGGNFGPGGMGGFQSNACGTSSVQSINGEAVNYTDNIVFLGGAGGGGQQDNDQPVAIGGNGGGIVIIKAVTLNGNNNTIFTDGENIATIVRDEGGAGGGAGGSVLLYVNNYANNVNIEANGGNGSSNNNTLYPALCHGPGGGGGGGYIGLSLAFTPGNIAATLNGGIAGSVLNPASSCFNTTNGASNGVSGGFNFNLVLPEATIPFKKNIDSVRINSNLITCKTFTFNGIGYTNTNPIQNWQWNFGDGAVDNVQNPTHTYAGYGTNTIKLVATDINGCKDSISKTVTTSGINFDFVFEQDVCNPLTVHFRAVGDTTTEIYWNKGDGTFTTTIRNPTNVYPAMGSYLVEYCTGNASTGCIDTVRKTIFVGWVDADIIATPDTTICYGTSKLLRSSIDSTLQFCWSPNSFLNNINFANPTTNTPSTITYTLLAKSEENNVVANGDFSNGNTAFISDYNAGTAPLATEEYVVATSSLNTGLSTANCIDHTTGTGNMLIAKNDFSATAKVWGQTVTVQPNTSYTFTAWVQSVVSPNNTQLQLSINGNVVVDTMPMPAATCNWVEYSVLWNSGNNTTANLAVMNKSLVPGIGGYFAIDDVSLAAYSIKKDTVKIAVDTPFVDTRADTSVCETVPVTLNTIGATSYSWSPATGLSNPLMDNPVATPTDTTTYFVTGTNTFGCTATDSVTIAIKPTPAITSTGDTTICRNTPVTLFATGGGSYAWSPAASLNNAAIATPTANATIADTKYVVTVTGTNNCTSKDSFTVAVTPVPVYTVSADQSVCLNSNVQLNASGGNYYLWSPGALVNNPNISNPLAITTNNTLYAVLVRDTVCSKDTTLTTNVTILPLPAIAASKENDINCAVGSSQLTATGGQQYNWVPANTLNDAASPSPVASPVNTTTYTVTGTDTSGCSNTATVTVITDYAVKVQYEVPNAFSPNDDGRNDCFAIKYYGLVTELQFAIYNRWGEKVFFTTNPDDCWDGTYKGKPCNMGNYVYYIKAKTTCRAIERKGNLMLVR